MEPDPSSRTTARRIVEEVIADHATRATAFDGAMPVTLVERPDTASWRAARRIVEQTLAEHAVRAVAPPGVTVEVVVDLEARDVEVTVVLDGPPPPPDPTRRPGRNATGPDAEARVVSVTEAIARDETPAMAARRIVETVLVDHATDGDRVSGDDTRSARPGPVPAPLAGAAEAGPNGASATGAGGAAGAREDTEQDVGAEGAAGTEQVASTEAAQAAAGTGQVASTEAAQAAAGTERLASTEAAEMAAPEPVAAQPEGAVETPALDASDRPEPPVLAVDETLLRQAIPERLFGPQPEPDPTTETARSGLPDTDARDPAAHGAVESDELAPDAEAPAETAPGPPPPPVLGPPPPPDPDAPIAIAARIVADVLADRERAAQEALEAEASELEAADAVAPRDRSGSTAMPEELPPEPIDRPAEPIDVRVEARTLVIGTQTGEPGTPVATQPPGVADRTETDEAIDEAAPVLVTGAPEVEDLWPQETAPRDPRPQLEPGPDDPWPDEPWPDDPWAGGGPEVAETEDEFGHWPDPIVPPRRTGRWLLTTVLGALALALMLPLAIGALRDLVSFS